MVKDYIFCLWTLKKDQDCIESEMNRNFLTKSLESNTNDKDSNNGEYDYNNTYSKKGNIFNIVVVIYTLSILNSMYRNARVGSF